MIIDSTLAGKLLNQWGRWASQSINAGEIKRETGQHGDNPLAIKKNTVCKPEFNEPLMILIDGILKSSRLSERQKVIAPLEWKVRPHWDQEQRKRCYNRDHPHDTLTIEKYWNTIRSIKAIVADGVQKNQAILIRDTLAMKKHTEKYFDKTTGKVQNRSSNHIG